jgi:hypothetical protein
MLLIQVFMSQAHSSKGVRYSERLPSQKNWDRKITGCSRLHENHESETVDSHAEKSEIGNPDPGFVSATFHRSHPSLLG